MLSLIEVILLAILLIGVSLGIAGYVFYILHKIGKYLHLQYRFFKICTKRKKGWHRVRGRITKYSKFIHRLLVNILGNLCLIALFAIFVFGVLLNILKI